MPSLTFPVYAVAIGHPDGQTIQELKPRLPQELIHFENGYQVPDNANELLNEYDSVLSTYYAHRTSNRRSTTFRDSIMKQTVRSPKKRRELFSVLQAQGFLTDNK